MKEKPAHKHIFVFNGKDNGGESLSLTTEFFYNGDGAEAVKKNQAIYTNQTLTLNSYCNSASIHLCGTLITPSMLRELANQLDQANIEAKNKILASSV